MLSLHLLSYFLSFILFNVVYITSTDLRIVNHLCTPRINLTCSWCMILLMLGEFGLLIFSENFFRLYSSVILACNFLFVWPLPGFGIRVMLAP